MKKILCLFLATAILIWPTACTNTSNTGGTTEQNGESVHFDETEDLAALYKEYFLESLDITGGTGYDKKPDQLDRIVFNGEEIRLNVRLKNDRFDCDYGLYVIVNGVFQSFSVLDEQGETSDYAYMQTFDLKADETVDVMLAFTPNTGSVGEELPLIVPCISQPSYQTEYTGEYARYGHFYEHAFRFGANCLLRMDANAPNEMQPAQVDVTSTELPQYYKELYGISEESREFYDLIADEKQAQSVEKQMVLMPQRSENAAVYFDVSGFEASFRVTLFVNHVPVSLSDGSNYAEFAAVKEKLTRVALPIDTSSLPENSHAYLWICDTEIAKERYQPGTYDIRAKLGTYYLLPSYASPAHAPSDEIQTNGGTTEENGDQTLSFIPDRYYARFIAKTDRNTLCVVAKDGIAEEASFQAASGETVPYYVWFYDIQFKKVLGQCELRGDETRFFAADGRLYAMNDPSSENVWLRAWDQTGTSVFSKELTDLYDGVPSYFDIQTMLFTYLSPAGDSLLYNTVENGAVKMCLLSLENGGTSSVPVPDEVCLSVKGFDGENILSSGTGDEKTSMTVYSLKGEKRGAFSFGKAKSVVGQGRYYAAYDFGQNNGSTVTVLDIAELTETEISLSTGAEGRRFLLSEDGETLLSYNDEKTFYVYSVKEKKLKNTFDIDSRFFSGMMFSCIDADKDTAYLSCGDNGSNVISIVHW